MIKNVFWASIFALAAAILQSTVLSKIALFHAVPDLALCIVVFCAYVNGSMSGQLSGFCSGLLIDFLSAAPLGLNAFVRTLTGALVGLFKGSLVLDFFILPIALCAGATLFKAIVVFLLSLLFSNAVRAYPIAAPTLWIELGMNVVAAPLLFALLKKCKKLLTERGSF